MPPLAETIIQQHSIIEEKVIPGQIVSVYVDKVYMQDGNSPTVSRLFKENDFFDVFNSDAIGVFFDHSVLSPVVQISDKLKEAEEFANKFNLRIFKGGCGISHVVAIEEGWFQPGNLVVATDSHTCTGGVVQSLALGMGASDVVATMVTGKTWLRVPKTVWIETRGTPSKHAGAKDVMLYTLSKFKDTTFLYKSIEWCGDWVKSLSFDQASTVANMAVEMGAKCVFIPPLAESPFGVQDINVEAQDHDDHFILDIDELPPFIALPNSPYKSEAIDKHAGQSINYVFVGSCANSRLEDVAEVAQILQGNSVNKQVRFIVTPGSKRVYLEAIKRGYIETIIESGGIVTPPGCGACVGTQGYIPACGDNVLSTMNRNFLGRMGNSKALIWLASPKIAAYTGILGVIPSVSDMQ